MLALQRLEQLVEIFAIVARDGVLIANEVAER